MEVSRNILPRYMAVGTQMLDGFSEGSIFFSLGGLDYCISN